MGEPAASAVEGGAAPHAWRRVHPVSPLLNAWKVLTALLAYVVYQNLDLVKDAYDSPWVQARGVAFAAALVGGGLLVFLVVVGAYSFFAWRRTAYAVTPEAVWYRSGIVFRSQRHARTDRIQAVDVVHPLLGRLFGLGRLSIEVAGGAESSLVFGFLSDADLQSVRAEILGHVAGREGRVVATPAVHEVAGGGPEVAPAAPARTAGSAAADGGANAGETREHPVYAVPAGRLIGSLFLNLGVLASIVFLLGGAVALVWVMVAVGAGAGSAFVAWLPAILGLGSYLWGRFAGEFAFRAGVSADGIRIHRGLTETRSQTIPTRRIHAVEIKQPWLWRRRGWYRVVIAQAGYGPEAGGRQAGGTSGSHDVLLPVGEHTDMELAVWLVLRDLGVPEPQRWLRLGFEGAGGDGGFVPVPARARPLDPLVWRRRAVLATPACVLIRSGLLHRRLTIVPYERVQSLGLSQGPWERSLGLADLHVHVVPGPVAAVAHHMDAGEAARMLGFVAARVRARQAGERPEEWRRRVAGGIPQAAGVLGQAPAGAGDA